MYAEPTGFDRRQLAATLSRGWGIEAGELTYVPAGFGTHHYRAGGRWWVNVDVTPGTAGLDKALRAVAALAQAGLEFVHPPQQSREDGGYVAAMPGGYAVSVFELLEGESYPYGEFPDETLKRQVLAALARMHATAPKAAAAPEPDTLDVPHRDTVFDGLSQQWTSGPFGEPARLLIRQAQDHIARLLQRYDELVPKVLRGRAQWVVTHGEPHAGNVMRLPGGAIKLIDWDTVRLGPPERDLWMIAPSQSVDADALDLYRRRWELSEICGYAATLRAPHTEDANTRIAWRELRSYLSSSSSQEATGSPHCA